MDFYSLHINTPSGKELSMKDYKGKVVLIVNTATNCKLASQFDELEKLYIAYKDQGLVIIGTPCNQFNNQEPLENEEMIEACRVDHGVTFQLTEKIDVNGADTHPLYQYLKRESDSFFSKIFGNNIKWNFTKFLINRDGKLVKRYSPTTKPAKIMDKLKTLLNSNPKNCRTKFLRYKAES